MVHKLGGSGKKSEKRQKAVKKAREDFHKNLPESGVNPNGAEDFESLLLKAATTIEDKPKKRKYAKKSRRDKSVKVEMGLFPKKNKK